MITCNQSKTFLNYQSPLIFKIKENFNNPSKNSRSRIFQMSQHGHLQEMHVSLAWQDIDTHRATFRKAAEVSQSVPYSREETVSEKLRYTAS